MGWVTMVTVKLSLLSSFPLPLPPSLPLVESRLLAPSQKFFVRINHPVFEVIQ